MASAQMVLPVPAGPSEVKGKTKTGGMPFAKAPALEDEIVLRNLGQRGFKRTPRRRRKNDIIKTAARRDAFDRAAASNAKETRKCARAHPLHHPVFIGQNQYDRTSSSDLPCIVCRRSKL